MDERTLREIIRAGMDGITESLTCPVHRKAEPIVGTLINELDFATAQFSGLPDPVCVMELSAWNAALVRCPNAECGHFSKQRCPRCGNWRLEFRRDGPVFLWRCAACPLVMELIKDPPTRVIAY